MNIMAIVKFLKTDQGNSSMLLITLSIKIQGKLYNFKIKKLTNKFLVS